MRSSLIGMSDWTSSVFRAGALRAEVTNLRQSKAAADLYNERVTELEDQIESLNALLKLPPTVGKTRVPAVVTGYFPTELRMTLNVGSKQGIERRMPVITGTGLLGVVDAVSANACQIDLISSFQLRVGAMVLSRNDPTAPAIAGLLRGEGGERLVLEFVETSAEIEPGDLVVTSGYSDKTPRGIPIGRVTEVRKDEDYGSRKVSVAAMTRLGESREVFVLK
ncbi:MAG: rod shape-determining protein MreC [Chthonomonas sp.]|nr:rod shape-determining protein MreC [Chthonomonas sp.]